MDENFFYDPLKCAPFYANSSEPIWYGRVENMSPVNQNLFIYGFVTTSHPHAKSLHGKVFEIDYDLFIRGKNEEDQEWTLHTPKSTQSVKAECREGHHLCTYFPVGYVPFLKLDTYDVAILIKPTDTLNHLEATSIDFHIAYFNPEFTKQ